jgi:hypothetical protein
MDQYPAKIFKPVAFKPINAPVPISVRESPSGRPLYVNGHKVDSIEDSWRIDDEWWRPARIERMYWSVILESGQVMTIFRDGVDKKWYKQRY